MNVRIGETDKLFYKIVTFKKFKIIKENIFFKFWHLNETVTFILKVPRAQWWQRIISIRLPHKLNLSKHTRIRILQIAHPSVLG